MKRTWSYIAVLLLLNSAEVGANSIQYAQQPPTSSNQQKLPSTPKDDPEPNLDGLVEVSFKIDSDGKVQILTINSTSPQLADYVIKKLGKVKLDQGSSQTGKVIKYSFVFKKQT